MSMITAHMWSTSVRVSTLAGTTATIHQGIEPRSFHILRNSKMKDAGTARTYTALKTKRGPSLKVRDFVLGL
jgi:hypothetical protein